VSARLIVGTVVDARGEPVAGATVYFVEGPVPLPDIAAVTDAEGRFTLTAPAPGPYTVGGAFDDVAASEHVTVAQGRRELTLRLGRAQA
jgi:protocatechuate 3,4-dioxygenase beta subunit